MPLKRLAHAAICSCMLLATTAFSADAPLSLIECTPTKILLCETDKENCDNIPVVAIDGAYLLKVDLKKKFSETFAGTQKVSETKIDRIETHGNLLFLYGYQDDYQGKPLPHSWTAVIDPQTDRLTVTSVANGIGYMLNGHCNTGKGDKP